MMSKGTEDLMSREGIETLMDRWTNDPAFRTQMRADPEGTVRTAGVSLDAEEWAALRCGGAGRGAILHLSGAAGLRRRARR